jgi:hypothetical protein
LCPFATGQREYERERVVAGWGGLLVDLARRERRKKKKGRRNGKFGQNLFEF